MQSYWFDEVVTVRIVRSSFVGMFRSVWGTESTPPLYYVVAWFWIRLFGSGEAALRALSAVAGTLTIPVTFCAGRRLVSPAAGLLAAAFVALSPFLIWYSQEARAYSFLALFGALSLWLFARAWAEPSGGALAWWALASILAVWSHYFALFLVLPEAVLLLWRHPRVRSVFAALAGVLVALLMIAPLAYHQSRNGYNTWIAETPWHQRFFDAAEWFVAGRGGVLHVWVIVGGMVAVAAVLLWATARNPEQQGAFVAALIGVFAIVAPLAAAGLGHDFWFYRNLIGAWPPLAVALAAAVTGPRSGRALVGLAAAAGALLLLASSVFAGRLVLGQFTPRDNWRGFARCLTAPAPDRLFVVNPLHNAVALGFYHGALRPLPNRPVRADEIVAVGRLPQGFVTPDGFHRAAFACSAGIRASVLRSARPHWILPAQLAAPGAVFKDAQPR